jgi:hypothetical protein
VDLAAAACMLCPSRRCSLTSAFFSFTQGVHEKSRRFTRIYFVSFFLRFFSKWRVPVAPMIPMMPLCLRLRIFPRLITGTTTPIHC